jgi:hypothetical protein
VDDEREHQGSVPPLSAQAVGTLIAYLETGGLERRRPYALQRLRKLRESDEFTTLPADLRERIREIVSE